MCVLWEKKLATTIRYEIAFNWISKLDEVVISGSKNSQNYLVSSD